MSVQRLNNGSYKIRYRIGNKQYSKSGFLTKREAEAYEAEQLRALRSNTWTDPKFAKVTLQFVFDDWIIAKQVSERTRSDYREVWRCVIGPEWAARRLTDITPASITRWFASLNERHSAARLSKAETVLSQVFDWAVFDGRILDNPLKRAKSTSRNPLVSKSKISKENRFLTHSEVSQLADASGEYSLMIWVMAYTGMRFGEVTALQVRDIDLLRNRIFLQRAWSDVAGRLVEVPPKSGKARVIPIPTFLQKPLENRIHELSVPESLFFTAQMGGPVRYARWRRDCFDPAVRSSGLIKVTPHALRHTYAALAVQAGANPKVLQSAMGHSDIRLTLDTYGGLFGDDLDALAIGLDDAAMKQQKLADVPLLFPLVGTSQTVANRKAMSSQVRDGEKWSRLGDLNPGPTHYECVALPLS